MTVDIQKGATSKPDLTSSKTPAYVTLDISDMSKQDHWSAWILANRDILLPAPRIQPASVMDITYDPEVQAHVQSIIKSSANTLSKGTSISGLFPYSYVKRGDETRTATINSCSLPKKIWGIFAMIKDPDR